MQIARQRLDDIVQGLKTKSDKIRALGRERVPVTEIAKYLDIRYQHARNVLVDSGLHSSKTDEVRRNEEVACDNAPIDNSPAWVEVDSQGRVQLPVNLLQAAGVRAGTKVHIRVSDDAIEILSQRAALKRAHDIVRKFVPPGVSLVDDLIAERRREAQKEEEGL